MLDSFASFDIALLGAAEHHPRKHIWKNILSKMKEENLLVRNVAEYDKLVKLKGGMKWMDMIDKEWKDIYSALFDEHSSFDIPASEISKIEKDVHRTFGLFSRNVPLMR